MEALPLYRRSQKEEVWFPRSMRYGEGAQIIKQIRRGMREAVRLDARSAYDSYLHHCSTVNTDEGKLRQHLDMRTYPQCRPCWKVTWIEWRVDALDAAYPPVRETRNEGCLVVHLRRGMPDFDMHVERCRNAEGPTDLVNDGIDEDGGNVEDVLLMYPVFEFEKAVAGVPVLEVICLNKETQVIASVEFKPTHYEGGAIIWHSVYQVPLFCFALLNCKNIKAEEVVDRVPTGYTGRKRALQTESLRYHVLKVDGSTTGTSHEGTGEGSPQGLHICRGNFAHYTADKPLFGKYTGLFWRPQHVRGDRKHGTIEKTYSIDVPDSETGNLAVTT